VDGQPFHGGTRLAVDLGPLEEVAVVLGVSSGHGVEPAVVGEPLECISSRRLKEAIARHDAGILHHQERSRGQVGDTVDHRGAANVGPGHDRARRVQREGAREDGEAPQDRALDRGKKLVAPVERGSHRLVPRQGGAMAAGEQPEPIVQAGGELVHPEGGASGGGQLDGQWDAIQPSTNRAGERGRSRVQGEGSVDRLSASHEQLDRGRLDRMLGMLGVLRRQRERGHAVDVLPRGPQRLLAGGQHPRARIGMQQRLGHPGCRLDHVLAVVQHEQQVLRFDRPRHALR
jgi:hypothetical protein